MSDSHTHRRVINLVIFDFDGTLADTAPVIIATMTATLRLLGLPPRTPEECRATIGLRLEDAPAVLYPGQGVDGDLFARTYRAEWHNHNKPGAVKLYPGALECLHRLHGLGIEIAIGSSRNHESLDEFVRDMGLTDMVCCVVGGDDLSRGKPDPEIVNLIMERCGNMPARDTMMVGDSEFDIRAANAAHAESCAVTWGYGTQESLRQARPTFVVNSFDEIVRICTPDLV